MMSQNDGSVVFTTLHNTKSHNIWPSALFIMKGCQSDIDTAFSLFLLDCYYLRKIIVVYMHSNAISE